MKNQHHPFHLVDASPWPLTSSLGAGFLALGLVKWFQFGVGALALAGLLVVLLSAAQWWRDVVREATYQGRHTLIVRKGLKYGMILFIVSEIMFFFSLFWAFFHSSLSPTMELGLVWPPKGVTPLNPFAIPLLNTIVLLSSGATVTWAHYSVLAGDHMEAVVSLTITVLLGVYFTCLQLLEYWEASFTIADSVYGSVFFVTTGFHGFHVTVGTVFLLVCLGRLANGHFSKQHHFGLEAAVWYWHFVDVVWLLLYASVYWWGS